VLVGCIALATAIVWGAIRVAVAGGTLAPLPLPLRDEAPTSPAGALLALGVVLFVIGGVDTLSQIAPELEPPRILNLHRVARIVGLGALALVAPVGFLTAALVPDGVRQAFSDTPIVGLVLNLGGPGWLRALMLAAAATGGVVMMAGACRSALAGAQNALARMVDEGLLPRVLRAVHPRFGTPWRIVNLAPATQIGIVAFSGGQVGWLTRAYGVAVAWCVVLKIAAVVRLRTLYRERQPYRVRGNFDVAGREWPLLLIILILFVAPASIFLTATFDPGSVVGVSLVLGLTAAVSAAARRGEHAEAARSSFDELQLLASDEVELRNVEARAGNLLVPVRQPHALTHLNAPLSDAGARAIVVVTARLIGIDVPDETAIDTRVTEVERQLFAAVTTLAERRGRAVRLLIAPGINVFDTVVETA